jgi:hypothetical protein
MSNAREIVKRAIVLLDRADELRAEARAALEPIYEGRGWRGTSDLLSGLMNFDLPKKSNLPAIRAMRREKLLAVASELDAQGVVISAAPAPRKTRGR